jgi:hypothetical protein
VCRHHPVSPDRRYLNLFHPSHETRRHGSLLAGALLFRLDKGETAIIIVIIIILIRQRLSQSHQP